MNTWLTVVYLFIINDLVHFLKWLISNLRWRFQIWGVDKIFLKQRFMKQRLITLIKDCALWLNYFTSSGKLRFFTNRYSTLLRGTDYGFSIICFRFFCCALWNLQLLVLLICFGHFDCFKFWWKFDWFIRKKGFISK